jgi:hypothetical protein
MARRASKQPTDGELEILKVLWDLGPAGLGQIVARSREPQGDDIRSHRQARAACL